MSIIPLLCPGDRGPTVAAVRRRLGVFPVVEAYDETLASRVRGLQLVNGLPVTGALDVATVSAVGLDDLVREGSVIVSA